MKPRERDAKLDALYDELPTITCQGKCEESCGPIEMTKAERSRIERRTGKPLGDVDDKMMCPLLTPAGWCSVYSIRPAICRLWGLIDTMRCPHGCVPEGGFWSTERGFKWLARVFDAMGEDTREAVGTTPVRLVELQRLALLSHIEKGGTPEGWVEKGMRSEHRRAGKVPVIER